MTVRKIFRGFTLIELLIVVAIIAILAAIAVPNFLEAQTRAKIARVKNDLRTVTTALESYRVDYTQYPSTPLVSQGDAGVMRVVPNNISTPISYVTTANMLDPFAMPILGDFQMLTRAGTVVTYGPTRSYPDDPGGDPLAGRRYYYNSHNDNRRVSFAPDTSDAIAAREVSGMWAIGSLGPDRKRNLIDHPVRGAVYSVNIPYDPTNGTISDGDIIRSQKHAEGNLTD